MTVFFVLFTIFSGGFAFVIGTLFGGLTPWLSAASLFFGYALAKSGARRLRPYTDDLRLSRFSKGEGVIVELVLFVFVTYVATRHFLWVLYPADASYATLTPNNFGDLPLHINYIRELAHIPSFPPLNPSFATQKLLYPFGPDLFNALWESVGVRLHGHLFAVGLFSTLASLVLLRAFGGWWAMGAFFLNGGLAGWNILQGSPLRDSQSALDWKSLFLAVFLPQRGMQFALPAGLLLLHLYRKHVTKKVELTRHALGSLGLLWGVLPLFHLHAFVIVSMMLAGYAFIEGRLQGLKRLFTSRMFFVALIPATYFVLRSAKGGKAAGIVHLDWAWTAEPANFLTFAWFNFGPWLFVPVAIAILLWAVNGKKAAEPVGRLKWEFAMYVALLAIFFNVMMAPWNWDNIKLLIWPYLGLARLGQVVIDPWFETSWNGIRLSLVRWVVASVLLLSGFTSLVVSIQSPSIRGAGLYQRSDLANVEGALADVPMKAIFAAATSHNHALTWFGRLRVVGYEGHLWSHGIEGGPVVDKLKSLMSPEAPSWRETVRELGITHVFWGPSERQQYGEGPRPWMGELKNVSRVAGYGIYSVADPIER